MAPVSIFYFYILVLLSSAAGSEPVTCGSFVKLTHLESKFQLHSHEILFGSGSKQQSVTGIESLDDDGNFWMIKEAFGAKQPCIAGEPISCGSTIRLEHKNTERNLHTHRVQSPLSRQQEVSCFQKQEDGDVNDNWILVCVDPNNEVSSLPTYCNN